MVAFRRFFAGSFAKAARNRRRMRRSVPWPANERAGASAGAFDVPQDQPTMRFV